jgi:hypothetical protein
MLVRHDRDGVILIGQASHAWISGQLARAWGNERFAAPDPFEEVCLAAEQHDVGWIERDLEPVLDPSSGWPQSFMQTALDEHLALWRAAPDRLLSQSRYAALLVSLHGSALYGRRRPDQMTPVDRAKIESYLRGERERQNRLASQLGVGPEERTRNQRLIFAWDAISLALCLGWPPRAIDQVPVEGGETVELSFEPGGGERSRLEPWPFALRSLEVCCEGVRLDRRPRDRGELLELLRGAAPRRMSFTLCRDRAQVGS